jgi:hypothetical protein
VERLVQSVAASPGLSDGWRVLDWDIDHGLSMTLSGERSAGRAIGARRARPAWLAPRAST